MDEYLESYLVSHPCIISHRQHGEDVRPFHVGYLHVGSFRVDATGLSSDVSPLPSPFHGADEAQHP